MGKVAVITGATSGIGLAAAKLFVKKGYTVYGVARKPYGGNDFKCFSADVCNYAAMDGIFKEIYAAEGGIDVFVTMREWELRAQSKRAPLSQLKKSSA